MSEEQATEYYEPEFCAECPFKDWGYAEPELIKDSDILFVGKNPQREDVEEDQPFTRTGDAGKILRQYLKLFDEKGLVYSITNAVKCGSPGKKDPGLKVIRRCAPLLKDDIEYTKPKLIVVLGKIALTAMTGIRTGITKLNGHILREYDIPILVCLHPASICYSKDSEKAEKQFQKGIYPALYFFDEQEKLPYAIKRTLQPSEEEVGFDIETNELNPLVPGATLRCFSVSDGKKALFVKVQDGK